MKKTHKKAFTLVELIVVITILAILWTIAFISFKWYSSNARDGVRIADLNSIKKNLELFITEKWFYPTPDNGVPITYLWWLARTQWTVWNNVITNLVRLNKKPTDPLTNSEYTYSITNAKIEYQLSSIIEWWLSYDIPLTNQIYAATSKTATAKVVWTYNEKLLKVSTGWIDYILAVPSIINADLTDSNLQSIINNRKLVYNNYQNLPDSYKNLWYTMTGWFEFAPPSNIIEVYTWSLVTLTSSGIIQQQFITKLQTVYNTTIIQSEPTIKDILFATTPEEQQILVWNYIDNHVWWLIWINTVITEQLYINCSRIWDILIWTTTYGSCNAQDLIVCTWIKSWYTLAACNVWTNISGTWSDSYWYYFQWGNNGWTLYWNLIPNSTIIDASWYWPWTASWYYNSTTFISTTLSPRDWTNPKNDNLWWNTINTDEARRGPCEIWYHIPSIIEFQWIVTSLSETNWAIIMNTLRLPKAGNRNRSNWSMQAENTYAYYWSSSPTNIWNPSADLNAHALIFDWTNLSYSGLFPRSYGFSIRCIKN